MTEKEIRSLQRAMNKFTEDHKGLGHPSLRVDGDLGQLTKKRLRELKYDLGYARTHIDDVVDAKFFWRLQNPDHVSGKLSVSKEDVQRGKKHRRERRAAVRKNRIRAFLKPGVTTFDGVPVAKCAVPILRWCREHGWQGRLVSGYRTPEYSESLCYRICGAPSCPGRCAGRATNHAYAIPERFAMDVSDYVNFGHIVANCPLKPHVHNELPQDLVHFSPSGR